MGFGLMFDECNLFIYDVLIGDLFVDVVICEIMVFNVFLIFVV